MFRAVKFVYIAFIVANSCLLAQQDNTPLQDLDTGNSFSSPSKELMPFSEGPSFTRMWITIAAALALLFSTLWLMRRFKTGHFKKFSNSSTLNVLEKRALSPKTLLYIIEIDGKRLLISESQVEVRTLNQEIITRAPEET